MLLTDSTWGRKVVSHRLAIDQEMHGVLSEARASFRKTAFHPIPNVVTHMPCTHTTLTMKSKCSVFLCWAADVNDWLERHSSSGRGGMCSNSRQHWTSNKAEVVVCVRTSMFRPVQTGNMVLVSPLNINFWWEPLEIRDYMKCHYYLERRDLSSDLFCV